jgi:hypothetical protein
MATRTQIKERSIAKVRRERAAIPWQYFLVSMSCALVLAAGFFYAAKQHFTTVDYSMRNSDMRKIKEKLEAEQRKLKVEREAVSAPATIEKAGIKMGLVKYTSQDFQYIDPSGNVTSSSIAANLKKPADAKGKTLAGDKTGVVKTASVKPVTPEKKDTTARDSNNFVAKLTDRESVRATVARK